MLVQSVKGYNSVKIWICLMKHQILFPEKFRKNNLNLFSAEFAHSILCVYTNEPGNTSISF